LAITGLGRIVIGRWQLTAGGLLRKPAQLDNARRDKYVSREASHGVAVRHFWRWGGHSARLSHGRPSANCNAYEFARLDFLECDSVCYRVCRFQQNSTRTRLPIPGLSMMAGAGDPVATGLVESLARPGGNVTG
jgi:hypothetical protein